MGRTTDPDDISPNKVNARQEHEAEKIRDKLIDQGVGRDEAEKRALRQAVDEVPGGGRAVGGSSTKHPDSD